MATMLTRRAIALLAVTLLWPAVCRGGPAHPAPRYPWLRHPGTRSLEGAFAPPPGYHRVRVAPGSFGAFLRDLPLRPPGTPVRAFDGTVVRAGNDPLIAAVADLDVGKRDLQQCADSIMRLHAEWLWSIGRAREAAYPVNRRRRIAFAGWRHGQSRAGFRRWLVYVFAEIGTANLADGERRISRAAASPGDFFVAGGHPGHAVLILDVAENAAGHKVALLGQGYMPAQDFQVLRGPRSAWFRLDGATVVTPSWSPFPWSDLRRLPR